MGVVPLSRIALHQPRAAAVSQSGWIHEQLTFSRFQLAAGCRSLTSDVFNGGDDYVQGARLDMTMAMIISAIFRGDRWLQ